MELHDDDQPIGKLLSRREMLRFLGSAGAAAFVGAGLIKLNTSLLAQDATSTPGATATDLPSCVVRPALTEGPYFVDDVLNRSDIRLTSDGSIKEGTLLRLIFNVSDVSNSSVCTPIDGAQVDVWHCDAQGRYSGVNDPGFNTSGETWLRGYQVTNEYGAAEFKTIYPGWYSGRAVHIHFKIRTDPESDAGYEFTSQFFFDEDLTDIVHQGPAYAGKGYRDTLNEDDGIFQGSEGLLTLDLKEYEDEDTGEQGYTTTFHIGLDLSQPSPSQAGGSGGPGGPGGRGGPGGNPPSGGRP